MEDPASELRLFLQGICCDYLLFQHLDAGVAPEAIRIRQEVALGNGLFADIEVRAGQTPLGRVRDFSPVAQQEIAEFTNDSGNHVHMELVRTTADLIP